MLRRRRDLADEFGTGIHTHSSETTWEVEESLRAGGAARSRSSHKRGILAARTVVAHCVWLDDAEIDLLAQTGTSVAHCPCSNMKLASGPARVGDMRRPGITVGLGTDGEKENNNLDLLEEMKFASLLAEGDHPRPDRPATPGTCSAMATIEGARALGLDDVTGSLEPGKRADVVTVDLGGLHTTPLLHGRRRQRGRPPGVLRSGRDVRDVWVDGRRLVAGGQPRTFDVASVQADAQAAAEELFDRRAHVLAAAGTS